MDGIKQRADNEPGIQLSSEQQDVLNELVNIGFGRAASSLSMLVNQRVLLNVPNLQICPLSKIGEAMKMLAGDELVNVHQVFRGKLNGHAMLLMNVQSAITLVDLMNGGGSYEGAHSEPVRTSLSSTGQEAMAEVGNIVINAFLGAFGNLLKIHIAFTIPSLRIETLVEMLHSLLAGDENSGYAMLVKIRFQLAERDVTGYLVILLGVQPLDSLLKALRKEGMVS